MLFVDPQFEARSREALSNAPTQPLKAAVLSAISMSAILANDNASCWVFSPAEGRCRHLVVEMVCLEVGPSWGLSLPLCLQTL